MNKFEADELLILAIMSKTPCVITEGVDDIRLYEEIAASTGVQCDIYSVEMLDGLAGGNDGVIEAMQMIELLPMPPGKIAKNFIMGIIDCDARYYRGEMPVLASILSLRAYSIESHFVSKYSIKPSIDKLTRISLGDSIEVDAIYLEVEKNVFDLYYFSLDALKNAVDPAYQSVIGFSANAGRRKNEGTIAELKTRKSELEAFAAALHLTSDIDSLRKFVKGKWLLTAYAEELFYEIEKLVAKCKSLAIKQCRMCERGDPAAKAPCLYQLRDGFNKNSLYSILKDFVKIPDLDYIRDAFKSLAASAKA